MNTSLSVLLDDKGSETRSIDACSRVVDAVRYMNNANIGELVVLEDGMVVGIFTERDVLMRVVAAHRAPLSTTVGDIMTRDPSCVTPAMSVRGAMVLITEKNASVICRRLGTVACAASYPAAISHAGQCVIRNTRSII